MATLLGRWMRSGPAPSPQHSGKKRDLLSLIGLLNHAASVVKPSRTFMRSLINESTTVKAQDYHVHLSAKARADIPWWYIFLQSWNGISSLPANSAIARNTVRCMRRLGVQGDLEQSMVPVPVAIFLDLDTHSPKRAHPHCIGHCCVGFESVAFVTTWQ